MMPAKLRRALSSVGRKLAAWAARVCIVLYKKSCRVTVRNDPRPALRAQQRPYVYALLHAQQVAAVLANDEPQMAAMVSRSRDGDILAAALQSTGVVPVRGSSARNGVDKGGSQALQQLAGVLAPNCPALLAVDGPRGPRGYVRRGVFALAKERDAYILPVVVLAKRSWLLRRTWDQTRIPYPFAALVLAFAEPFQPPQDEAMWPQARAALSAQLSALEAHTKLHS